MPEFHHKLINICAESVNKQNWNALYNSKYYKIANYYQPDSYLIFVRVKGPISFKKLWHNFKSDMWPVATLYVIQVSLLQYYNSMKNTYKQKLFRNH